MPEVQGGGKKNPPPHTHTYRKSRRLQKRPSPQHHEAQTSLRRRSYLRRRIKLSLAKQPCFNPSLPSSKGTEPPPLWVDRSSSVVQIQIKHNRTSVPSSDSQRRYFQAGESPPSRTADRRVTAETECRRSEPRWAARCRDRRRFARLSCQFH